MDNPFVIAGLLTLALALLFYALLVPRTGGRFIADDELREGNAFIKLAAIVGNEFYSALPARFTTGGRAAKNTRTASLFQRSGNPWKLKVEHFLFYRLVFAFFGLIGGVVFGLILATALPAIPWIVPGLVGAIFGFAIPNMVYSDAAKKRDLDFKRELPEALDLLVISISGGSTFIMAVRESLDNMQPGVLKEEFKTLIKNVDTGRTVNDSLNIFAERAPNDSITTFIKAVQEALELNVPIQATLTSRAEASRQDFYALVHARTATLEQRMSAVLAPTLMPALLLALLAPAVYSLVQSFDLM